MTAKRTSLTRDRLKNQGGEQRRESGSDTKLDNLGDALAPKGPGRTTRKHRKSGSWDEGTRKRG